MAKSPSFLRRLFHSFDYHCNRLISQDRGLEKQLTWPKDVPRGMPLPNWTTLLLGTVQAADFVLEFAELDFEEEKQIKQEAKRNQEIEQELVDKRFYQKQKLFTLAVLKKSVELQAQVATIDDQHSLATISIVLVCLLLVIVPIAFRAIALYKNPATLSSLISFANILMAPVTFALFTYSRLLHTMHNKKERIKQKLLKLSAASHSFKALDQMQILSKRLVLKKQEMWQKKLQTEQAKLKLDVAYRESLLLLEKTRLQALLEIAGALEFESERLVFLSTVLPQGASYHPVAQPPQSSTTNESEET